MTWYTLPSDSQQADAVMDASCQPRGLPLCRGRSAHWRWHMKVGRRKRKLIQTHNPESDCGGDVKWRQSFSSWP